MISIKGTLKLKPIKFNKPIFKKAIENAKEEMKTRTLSGKDIKGNDFKPYSQGYLKYKKKIRPEAPNYPDLFLTGKMLKNVRTYLLGYSGFIAIYGKLNNNKAKWNENYGRYFFGLNKKEIDNIYKYIIENKLIIW